MSSVANKFFEFQVYTARSEKNKKDRQIVDYEPCFINMEHVLSMGPGDPMEDNSFLSFPNGDRKIVKGDFKDLFLAIKETCQ